MKSERLMELAKRMLHLIDTSSTDLAPETYEQEIEAFTDPDLFERERQAIFGWSPMFIGMSNELPSPGSYFTRDFADTPFLAVRHQDGKVRLYLNACRHRGARVVTDACGAAQAFSCPFHGWSYDTDGRLTGVPEPEGFDDIDRHARGLIPLPVAEKYGMIFGCATPGVEIDPDEVLGGLGPELAEWGFEDFEMFGEPHIHESSGNWKYTWDTFCENYHFAFLHKNTLSDYLIARRQAFDVYGRNVRMISALKSIHEMRQLPEEEWKPEHHLSIQYRLYPSINFSVYPGFMAVFWVLPGRTVSESKALHITYLTRQPETEEERLEVEATISRGCEDVVQNEDFWVTGQAETTLRAPAASNSFVIGRNEPAVQHFHRLFTKRTQG